MPVKDGPSCPGCGLANYEGLCPVCRGDYPAYEAELEPFFGRWEPEPLPEHPGAEAAGQDQRSCNPKSEGEA